MRIIVGDLWEQKGYKVIPVNLSVNNKGYAVMGRGVAKQAVDKYPSIPVRYGNFLKTNPLDTVFVDESLPLILLPVKHHWKEQASINLITQGLIFVRNNYSSHAPRHFVYLPLLGCGFGELEPLPVMTLMAQILLDDNFVLVLKDDTVTRKYPYSFTSGIRQDRTA